MANIGKSLFSLCRLAVITQITFRLLNIIESSQEWQLTRALAAQEDCFTTS